jgi:hypothetical protein
MNQRFFRATDAVYEQVRAALDSAFGHPGDMAVTTFQPVSDAPHDAEGRAYLAVWEFFCEWDTVAAMLPDLLASGAVEEIDEAAYRSAVDSPPAA